LILEALADNSVPFINGGEPVEVPVVSNWTSLAVIVSILALTVVASLLHERRKQPADAEE
jgi:tellurite resistance protein TerC